MSDFTEDNNNNNDTNNSKEEVDDASDVVIDDRINNIGDDHDKDDDDNEKSSDREVVNGMRMSFRLYHTYLSCLLTVSHINILSFIELSTYMNEANIDYTSWSGVDIIESMCMNCGKLSIY